VYEKKKQYKLAIDYYYQSLKILEELEDKRAIAELFTLIGENLLQIGNPDDALDYFDQSLNIAQDIGARKEEMKNYEQLARLHAIKKSFDKAADYIEKYTVLKDSISIVLVDDGIDEGIEHPAKLDSGEKILRVYQFALAVASLLIISLIIVLLFIRFKKRGNKVN
jgi:tetratricopeptide (TPR) repeat protein